MDELTSRWPYCYHVTARANVAGIREVGALIPAAELLRAADRVELLSERRTADLVVLVDGRAVVLRNQVALDPAALHLEHGVSIRDYIAYLNSMVYFWPGTRDGVLTPNCLRMFKRAMGGYSALIRVPTRSLVEANRPAELLVSTTNAGAAWLQDGVKSRRSLREFDTARSYSGRSEAAVELSYGQTIRLPEDSVYAFSPIGPWRALACPPHTDHEHTAVDRRKRRAYT